MNNRMFATCTKSPVRTATALRRISIQVEVYGVLELTLNATRFANTVSIFV
jgi:hypothetical protein